MVNSPFIAFQPLLGQIFGSDFWLSYSDFCHRVLVALSDFLLPLLALLVWLGAIFGSFFLLHFFFTLPLRRAERARLFLDLLEGALNRGQPVEEMILSIAHTRDRTVGASFHLLAAHIEGGLKLGEALARVPRFLPPPITAMLRVGEKFGDLEKVLPACREILRDRPTAVRSAMHYLILVVLFFSPVFLYVMTMTTMVVIPEFRAVAAGMDVRLWPLTMFVFELARSGGLMAIEAVISLLMFGAVLLYIGGPQLARRLPLADWLAWRLPWKQKRLQRTFSVLLAVLLDGGVPEAEAVRLAGNCTANEICRRRAQDIVATIQQGTKLDEAVRAFDDSGEFHWRLTNATHARGGFIKALRGWHEALDAKAFQQEEATAHTVTTGVVVLNGLLVALICTAMFGIIVAVLDGMLTSQ